MEHLFNSVGLTNGFDIYTILYWAVNWWNDKHENLRNVILAGYTFLPPLVDVTQTRWTNISINFLKTKKPIRSKSGHGFK